MTLDVPLDRRDRRDIVTHLLGHALRRHGLASLVVESGGCPETASQGLRSFGGAGRAPGIDPSATFAI